MGSIPRLGKKKEVFFRFILNYFNIADQKGLFLGMQQPIEIPGLNNLYFLRAAYNAQRKSRGEKELDAFDFINIVRENMQIIGMDEAFLKRGVNEGFSGGEKKRNEIFQMQRSVSKH